MVVIGTSVYHRSVDGFSYCSAVPYRSTPVPEDQAKARGLRPCRSCRWTP